MGEAEAFEAGCRAAEKRLYTVEDVRAAFVKGADWGNWFEYVQRPSQAEMEREAQAEALRRWPEEDSHDK